MLAAKPKRSEHEIIYKHQQEMKQQDLDKNRERLDPSEDSESLAGLCLKLNLSPFRRLSVHKHGNWSSSDIGV